ncbi:NAD(P)/FAD-dependent oxidoreductase [Agrococcus baldri]|uniref:D-amino-acid oxidase n=1 Tax=Agrococcus baldri TaxID=153730 RepID=A0AA87RGI4_9MICO|nr:FAD-dependent oxidoreductase [Agrococcus baldri]GEK79173.1 D-amino-acid oxidase [Agrococcus baldri]
MSKRTFIVVGAGIVGCALAEELSRRGHPVSLVDAAEAGSGTSAATFAWINANGKEPEEYSMLNFLGLQAHERAAARGDRWFHQTGMMQIASSVDEATQLERNVANVGLGEYGARMLTRSEVLELEPDLDERVVLAGAIYPREGWLDVPTMCFTLLDRAIAQGVRYFPFERVTEIDGALIRTVSPSGAESSHEADVIVLAAGNGTKAILHSAGFEFPVVDPNENALAAGSSGASVGIISSTGPVTKGPRHFVRAVGIAVRPGRNGGVTFADHPTGGRWGLNDPEIWSVPELLLERARRLYPSLRAAATESVALGTRVLPEDGLTIADWIDESNQIYAIGTHSGVTLSAHLASCVADELVLGNRHWSLSRFGIDRFASVT